MMAKKSFFKRLLLSFQDLPWVTDDLILKEKVNISIRGTASFAK
jgi:hypothetical protein